jgi:hypothetical protein
MSRTTLAAAVLLTCAVVLAAVPVRGDDDAFGSRKAKAAKRDFDRATTGCERTYHTKVLAAARAYQRSLDDAQKAAMRGGDLEDARRISEGSEWLGGVIAALDGNRDPGRLTDTRTYTSEPAVSAQTRYRAAVDDATKARTDARRAALTKYAEDLDAALQVVLRAANDLPEAERIQGAQRRVQAELDGLRAAEGWVVLFRSIHPEDWNTSHDDGERLAVPLDQAPRELRFVRLRRVDTQQAVILAMTFDRLGQDAQDGQYGWSGARTVNEGGVHLGIGNEAWTLTFRDGGKILIGPHSESGWGFGHKVHANDHQYWAWAGDEIGPTAFEVAVTARDLTDDERGLLLVETH